MKLYSYGICRYLTLLVLSTCMISSASAATIVATASGSWNSSVTWNGVVPPTTISLDQIVIPAGIVVTADQNIVVDGVTASLKVDGSLTINTADTLSLHLGIFSGAGSLQAGTVNVNGTALISYTGSIDAATLNNNSLDFALSAQTRVAKQLRLSSGLMRLLAGGTVSLTAGATIDVAGGSLMLSGGALDLQESYNVHYIQASGTCGVELSGSGLRNVTIDIAQNSSLNLNSDLLIDGVLTVNSGTLILNNHDVFVNGRIVVAATAALASSANSSLSLHSQGELGSVLQFAAGNNTIENLNINVDSGTELKLISDLTIEGNLSIQGGALNFSQQHLSLKGDVSGAGSLRSDSASTLNITTGFSLHGALRFDADADTVKQLTVDVGTSNSVTLASNLTISSQLALLNRSKLSIAGQVLNLHGTLQGDGSLMVDTSTTFNVATTLQTTVNLSLVGNAIGTLNADLGAGSTIALQSDLRVQHALSLNGTMLKLNGYNLSIMGTIQCSTTAGVTSTEASSVAIMSDLNAASTLRFAGTVQTVQNLSLESQSSAGITLIGNVDVRSDANVNTAMLTIDSSELHVSGGLTLSERTRIHAVHHSSLFVDAHATVQGMLHFSADANELQNLVFTTDAADTIGLSGRLDVRTVLEVSNGVLAMDTTELHIDGNVILGTTAYLSSTAATNLSIQSTTVLSSALSFVHEANAMNSISINVDSAQSVTLRGRLDVLGDFKMQSGTVLLSNAQIGLRGTFEQSLMASLAADATSDISINALHAFSDAIRFRADANTLKSLTVHTADAASIEIGSDLRLQSALHLDATKLSIGANTLHMAQGAVIDGVDEFAYVQLAEQGHLALTTATSGEDTLQFPIGTATAYLATKLMLHSVAQGTEFSMGVQDSVRAHGLSGEDISAIQPVVLATWDLRSSAQTNLMVDLQVQWSAAKESQHFDRNAAYLSYYSGTSWDSQATGMAQMLGSGAYSMKRDNVQGEGQFAVMSTASTQVATNDLVSTFELSPSPADDYVRVSNFAATDDNLEVSILNACGQELRHSVLSSSSPILSLNGLANGFYMLRFHSAQHDCTNSLIVMHN